MSREAPFGVDDLCIRGCGSLTIKQEVRAFCIYTI